MSSNSETDADPLSDHDISAEWEASMRHEQPASAASFEAFAATLTQTQAQAAAHPGSILVLAGAGTGKTSTLTAAVVHRIAVDRIPAARILAVTFTNKAAGEMTGRIRAALGAHHNLCAAPQWLGTYHCLGARQLRASPEVARLRPNFDILDADDSRRIVKRTMNIKSR